MLLEIEPLLELVAPGTSTPGGTTSAIRPPDGVVFSSPPRLAYTPCNAVLGQFSTLV